jgi:HEAT repeat protein
MSASDAGTPGQRALLTPLFQALPFREHELKAIRSHHWEVRRDAAERLGYFGDTSLVPTLEGALQDETLDVRFAAARALVRLGSIRTVESTLRALDVPGEMIQRRVAETLSDLGPPAIEPLVEILKNHEPHHTENTLTVIARVLGMLRAHAAIPSLTRLTGHSDVSLRVNCVRALATIGDRSVVPAVTSLSEDPSWEVRNGVMHALGRLQATDQIPVIRKAIGDPVWWVRFSAARALYDLGQPGIQALQDGMREHTDRYAQEMCRQILQEHRIQNTPLPSP